MKEERREEGRVEDRGKEERLVEGIEGAP